jgi:dolichol-phosphate mannosyltransferase
MKDDLVVVMPVYNEEACIARVVKRWIEALRVTGASFQLLVLNDGSKDKTLDELRSVVEPELTIRDKRNEGHGPTILKGYGEAVHLADWVFQVDSDDELSPEPFMNFWSKKERFDMIFGIRAHRTQTPMRRLISMVSRLCVRLIAGGGVIDVNVPYRLMRGACLKKMIERIPVGTFAPNVAIAGLSVQSRLRIENLPVEFSPRRTGTPSLVRWSLARQAVKAMFQTASILLRR